MTIYAWFEKAKLEITLFALGALAFGLVLLSFALWSKNKKISELQNQIAVKVAKLGLEKIRAKYTVSQADIQQLRDRSAQVKEEMQQLEAQLTQRLRPNMTAEEIAAKFREIGL